jgi:Anaphase-promoting complex APC subunit CDC26
MLRRAPTRIELRPEDLEELDQLQHERQQAAVAAAAAKGGAVAAAAAGATAGSSSAGARSTAAFQFDSTPRQTPDTRTVEQRIGFHS